MKIAIPTMGKDLQSQVNSSFGRSIYFAIVESDTMEFEIVDNKAVNSQGGAGIKAAQEVIDKGIQVLITPHLGQNAANVLKNSEVKIMKAIPCKIIDLVNMFKNNELEELTEIHPGYHGGHR